MSKRKFNVNPDNVNDFLPPDTHLIVHHLHRGNSSDDERTIKGGKVSPYITRAMVVRDRINPDMSIRKRVLASTSAVCAPGDNPNRKLSYRIAAGRACRMVLGRSGA